MKKLGSKPATVSLQGEWFIHYTTVAPKVKVKKRAKIRNQYNQAPQLTQDTNGKVTISQLDIKNESQEVSPFPAVNHKAPINRREKQDRNNINGPQKKHRLRTVSKNILLEGLNCFHCAPTSPLVQMWIKTHRCLVCMKDPKPINASSPRTYKSRC